MTNLTESQTSSDANVDVASSGPSKKYSATALGTFFAIISALGYTGASIALRDLAMRGDADWALWVTCMKALPAASIAWLLIAYRASRGLPALPPRRLVFPLILCGLLVQIFGNVLIQWAFRYVGLALTVPISFATLLCCSALLGRIFLLEVLTSRTLISMALLTLAIILLCFGAESASTVLVSEASSFDTVFWGALAAGVAGVAYGMNGIVIRNIVTRDISLSATLVLISTTGFVSLGLLSLWRVGLTEILATSQRDMAIMLAAGTLNAIAFFALSAALKYVTVTQVNLLNSSQTAMAAAAGVFLFGESLTVWLTLGIALTVVGLLLMDNRPRDKHTKTDVDG
jgi:drug/metabolite transporter (DMT)-like permease